jgi:hypothetical protein
MAEINYDTEKCWQIEEVLPIQATVRKNRQNEWDIIIEKMTVSYDTFIEIETSLLGGYGASYDYKDGTATLSVSDKGLIELEELNELIVINK